MAELPTPTTKDEVLDPDIFRRYCQLEMLEYLNLKSILPHLVSNALVTQPEKEHLSNSLYTTQARILKLTRFLSSKGESCVTKFLQCLENEKNHVGHATLLEIIKSKLLLSESQCPAISTLNETETYDYNESSQYYCGLGK